MRFRLRAIAAVGAALLASAASAPANDLVVTPAWLASRIGTPGLVILHVGEKAGYERAHIPGAQFIDRSELSDPGAKLTLQMAPLDALRGAFEAHGISDGSRIVLYFGADWVSPTARVFVALDYLGLGDRTSILDGGLLAWTAAGHPVTQQVPVAARGRITASPHRDAIVDAEWVKAHLADPRVQIVDARTREFYTGDSAGMFPRPGHIKGATSLPFNSLTLEPSNALKDTARLKTAFEAAGATPGKQLVTYCHIGQQASQVYFVGKLLGYTVHLYDGSFEEWSAKSDLPVEKGDGKPR